MHYIDQYMLHLLREFSIKVRSGASRADRVPEEAVVKVCVFGCVC